MQRVRAAFLLLTALMTAITAIGMAMMPISPAASMVGNAATHAHHASNTRSDDGQHNGSDHCLYCHLAKATDLPPRHEIVTVGRRQLPRFAGAQTTSCDLPAWTTPCQPRAPPRPVAA